VGEEGLEFVADDGVEEGLLGLVAFVPVDGWGPIGTGLGTGKRKSASSGRCLVVPVAEKSSTSSNWPETARDCSQSRK